MTHFTIELLVGGDRSVIEYYQAAVRHWNGIWARPASTKVMRLATMLSTGQAWFEQHCGSCWTGQEIMVVSGFGMLYSTRAGFEDKADQARLLYDASQRSICTAPVCS